MIYKAPRAPREAIGIRTGVFIRGELSRHTGPVFGPKRWKEAEAFSHSIDGGDPGIQYCPVEVFADPISHLQRSARPDGDIFSAMAAVVMNTEPDCARW